MIHNSETIRRSLFIHIVIYTHYRRRTSRCSENAVQDPTPYRGFSPTKRILNEEINGLCDKIISCSAKVSDFFVVTSTRAVIDSERSDLAAIKIFPRLEILVQKFHPSFFIDSKPLLLGEEVIS